MTEFLELQNELEAVKNNHDQTRKMKGQQAGFFQCTIPSKNWRLAKKLDLRKDFNGYTLFSASTNDMFDELNAELTNVVLRHKLDVRMRSMDL